MKLSTPFAILAILPFIGQVSAGIFPRQDNQRNRGGGNNNNGGGNNNNDNNNNGGNDNTGANNNGGDADPQTSLSMGFSASLPE